MILWGEKKQIKFKTKLHNLHLLCIIQIGSDQKQSNRCLSITGGILIVKRGIWVAALTVCFAFVCFTGGYALPLEGYLYDNISWFCDDDGLLIMSGPAGYCTEMGVISGVDDDIPKDRIKQVEIHQILNIADYAFRDCRKLKSVVIDEGLEEIGQYAFYDCSQLEGIEFPESLRMIDYRAFHGCSSLKNLYLPDHVTQLASSFLPLGWNPQTCFVYANVGSDTAKLISQRSNAPAFFRDPATDLVLRYADFVDGEPQKLEVVSSEHADVFRLPNQCRRIEELAFAESGVHVVHIPKTTEEIAHNAFDGCAVFAICEAGCYAEQWCKDNHIPYAIQPEAR